jgi:hypothetical protein
MTSKVSSLILFGLPLILFLDPPLSKILMNDPITLLSKSKLAASSAQIARMLAYLVWYIYVLYLNF